jgi:hypothetical protein
MLSQNVRHRQLDSRPLLTLNNMLTSMSMNNFLRFNSDGKRKGLRPYKASNSVSSEEFSMEPPNAKMDGCCGWAGTPG